MAANEQAEAYFHLLHAFTALIVRDPATATRHAAQAVARIRTFATSPAAVIARLVPALALADQARTAPAAERARLITEFDRHHRWLAERAADAPGNYQHLDHWLRAERAWATGDPSAAARAFDEAEFDAEGRRRPWHRALIAERRGRFLLADGFEHAARMTLRRAAVLYDQWGAARKVAALHDEFPFLDAGEAPRPGGRSSRGGSGTVSAQTIDLLAVLRVCQAISSQTTVERLTAQVDDLLCGLTGATAARLVLRDEQAWFLPSSDVPR
jgi:hypothetical protein